ncbi:hypothetical protein Q3G72_000241 [Acer saccharum]|nr:hypothetical protein Q3G72_000241 [Acer saccharum]
MFRLPRRLFTSNLHLLQIFLNFHHHLLLQLLMNSPQTTPHLQFVKDGETRLCEFGVFVFHEIWLQCCNRNIRRFNGCRNYRSNKGGQKLPGA